MHIYIYIYIYADHAPSPVGNPKEIQRKPKASLMAIQRKSTEQL